MTRRYCVTITALGSLSLLSSGCGAHTPAAVTDRDAILRLKVDEYRIRPTTVRVIAHSLPLRVHIVAHNVGRLTHNVHVESVSADAEQGTDNTVIDFGGTPTAQPSATVSRDVYLQPGTYRMSDTVSNHDNLGGYGSLTVTYRR